MAERRMFAKTVINSARFLRMPPSSRLLYYDLGMAADDDGVVEAFTVIRTTGATEDDLRVLHAKGFVVVLNSDLVTYITDWAQNNQIRTDRYHKSVYSELLVKLSDGNQLATNGLPNGNQRYTEVSIGKDSIGKVSLGKDNNPPTPHEGEEKPDIAEMFGYNQFLLEAVQDWIAYKQEQRKPYKPVGLRNLLSTIQNKVTEFGESAVVNVIRESMGANYQGIVWDKLKNQNKSAGKKQRTFGDLYREEMGNDANRNTEDFNPFAG